MLRGVEMMVEAEAVRGRESIVRWWTCGVRAFLRAPQAWAAVAMAVSDSGRLRGSDGESVGLRLRFLEAGVVGDGSAVITALAGLDKPWGLLSGVLDSEGNILLDCRVGGSSSSLSKSMITRWDTDGRAPPLLLSAALAVDPSIVRGSSFAGVVPAQGSFAGPGTPSEFRFWMSPRCLSLCEISVFVNEGAEKERLNGETCRR